MILAEQIPLLIRQKLIKPRRLRRLPKWLYPAGVERTYLRRLLDLVEAMEQAVKGLVLPRLEGLFREAEIDKPRADDRGPITDSWAESVEAMIKALSLSLNNDFQGGKAMALDIGQKTAKWNSEQWQRILKAVLGVEVFQTEPWLVGELQAFAQQNVALITSLKDKTVRDIEGMTLRAIQGGGRHEDLRKEIQAQFGNTRSRAALIARDQVSKLNGNLTRLRQQGVGVRHYIWRTSRDERVRPTHRAHEGKTFSWDKPPAGTGHPGQDYQCRCTSEAIVEELFMTKAA